MPKFTPLKTDSNPLSPEMLQKLEQQYAKIREEWVKHGRKSIDEKTLKTLNENLRERQEKEAIVRREFESIDAIRNRIQTRLNQIERQKRRNEICSHWLFPVLVTAGGSFIAAFLWILLSGYGFIPLVIVLLTNLAFIGRGV